MRTIVSFHTTWRAISKVTIITYRRFSFQGLEYDYQFDQHFIFDDSKSISWVDLINDYFDH